MESVVRKGVREAKTDNRGNDWICVLLGRWSEYGSGRRGNGWVSILEGE